MRYNIKPNDDSLTVKDNGKPMCTSMAKPASSFRKKSFGCVKPVLFLINNKITKVIY